MLLAIYVDGGLILSKSIEVVNSVLRELESQFEITIVKPDCFVGMEIRRNRKDNEIFICQEGYINRLLQKFNMKDCKAQ